MGVTDIANIAATARLIVEQRDQRANLIDAEAEIAASTDERQPPHVGVGVSALPAILTVGHREQAYFLVVADRRRGGPGAQRQRADPKTGFHGQAVPR